MRYPPAYSSGLIWDETSPTLVGLLDNHLDASALTSQLTWHPGGPRRWRKYTTDSTT